MSHDPKKLAEMDQKHLLHPASSITQVMESGPTIMTSGKGVRVTDANGHELLDGVAGLWCVNVGYGREELGEVMKEAASEMGYYHSFTGMSNPYQIKLAEKLASIAPGKLTRVFFGSSGSDANDTILKIIWHYNNLKGRPEKRKVIARKLAYHGTSVSAASLTGIFSFHTAFNLPIPGILHTETPHYYRYGEPGESEREFSKRMADELEKMILAEGPDTVAAFFAEPIMGAGGVIHPPEGYFEEIQKVVKKYDMLMVADEVICGYGRLGVNFGSDLYGIEPDLMATAKGLTSGYFPMSAAYITEEIYDVLKIGSDTIGGFMHGYTYSGHPIGCAVALKNLEIIEREKLVENAATVGGYFHEQLNAMFNQHPHVGEVRGHGLLAGVQLMADSADKTFLDPSRKMAARIVASAYKKGLICRALPSVNSIAFSPPLTLTKAEADEILGVFKESLNEVFDAASADDLKGPVS